MIRVMSVDDDALVRLGLTDLLDGDQGIEVIAQAVDGLQAIEKATAHRIDVALVDVRMPRMDGITATTRLRALPHPPKVITLTTFDLDHGSQATRRLPVRATHGEIQSADTAPPR
ncbi:response regulator [Nonomuraea sp. CA-143628]|uniref:response regulator n=1 Tax=Nonomuraea sp. CA-143628 TaxID=3239997 RepID=UPI003D92EDBB